MSFLSVGGQPAATMQLIVPAEGPWFADFVLHDEVNVTGAVEVIVGEVSLQGTVDDRYSGNYGLSGAARVVAGANGWRDLLPAKTYHNDLRVRAEDIAQDAATEAGETLGSFAGSDLTVGVDYLRNAGPASRTLADAAGTATWWVDYDGITHVGTRTGSAIDPELVVDFDPAAKVATLVVDQLTLAPGDSITIEGQSLVIRELQIEIKDASFLVKAWVGEPTAPGRIVKSLRRIVERLTDGKLHGVYRYRVTGMTGQRVNLTPVDTTLGLPDALLVSMFPGVPGADADLTTGSQALVQFVDGHRGQPVVTQFVGPDGENPNPEKLRLLGGGKPLAGVGDSITVLLPPIVPIVGTINATTPFTGTMDLSLTPVVGVIDTGSNDLEGPTS